MKIPKLKKTRSHTYEFVKQINKDLFQYKDIKMGFYTTYSKQELGLIDNTAIDKKLKIVTTKNARNRPIIVFDKLDNTTTEYADKEDVIKLIGVSWSYIYYCITHKKWMKKRYFFEYKEVEDERN